MPIDGSDDMVTMEHLSEAGLLHNLRYRYEKRDQVYTYVGPTLLVINPYIDITGVISSEKEKLFQEAVNAKTFKFSDYPPHIFAIAAKSIKSLIYAVEKKNQAIVISGESGAGKTESTKHAMQFLTKFGILT